MNSFIANREVSFSQFLASEWRHSTQSNHNFSRVNFETNFAIKSKLKFIRKQNHEKSLSTSKLKSLWIFCHSRNWCERFESASHFPFIWLERFGFCFWPKECFTNLTKNNAKLPMFWFQWLNSNHESLLLFRNLNWNTQKNRNDIDLKHVVSLYVFFPSDFCLNTKLHIICYF